MAKFESSPTIARLRSDVKHLSKTERIKGLFRAHAELDRIYARSRHEMNSAVAEAKKIDTSALSAGGMPVSSEALGGYINDLQQLSEQMDASLPELKRRIELRINELLPETFNVGASSDVALPPEPRDTVTNIADGTAAAAAVALLFPGGIFVSAFLGGVAVGMYASVAVHDIWWE